MQNRKKQLTAQLEVLGIAVLGGRVKLSDILSAAKRKQAPAFRKAEAAKATDDFWTHLEPLGPSHGLYITDIIRAVVPGIDAIDRGSININVKNKLLRDMNKYRPERVFTSQPSSVDQMLKELIAKYPDAPLKFGKKIADVATFYEKLKKNDPELYDATNGYRVYVREQDLWIEGLRFLSIVFDKYLPMIKELPVTGEQRVKEKDLRAKAPPSKNFTNYDFFSYYTPKYQQMIIDIIPKIDTALEEGWVSGKDLRSWDAIFNKHSDKIGYSQHNPDRATFSPEVAKDFDSLRNVMQKLYELRDEKEQKEHVVIERSRGPAYDLLEKKLKEIIAASINKFEQEIAESNIRQATSVWEDLQKTGFKTYRDFRKEQKWSDYLRTQKGPILRLFEDDNKTQDSDFVTVFPKAKVDEWAKKQAADFAKAVAAKFVFKNLFKLGPLFKLKTLKDIKVRYVEVKNEAIHSVMDISFEGDSSFSVKNQLVYVSTFYTRFARYPTTFHDVIIDGKKMSSPSEALIYKAFSGSGVPKEDKDETIVGRILAALKRFA